MKFLIILLLALSFNLSAQVVSQGIPTGAVMKFDLTSCPTGWLPRDGSCVSKTTYSKLYQAIGSRYEGTFGTCAQGFFRLADARGLFARNAGTNATLMMANGTKYTGSSVGSYLSDAFQGHNHTAGRNNTRNVVSGGSYNTLLWEDSTSAPIITYGTNGTPRIAAETRPASISTLDCIKY